MNLSELWRMYEADKRIQGFSPKTLKAYSLQHKMLMLELGDLVITEVTLTMLKEYLAKQADRLKPSSLGHRIRFIRSLFRYAYEETYLTSNPSLKLREPKLDKRIPKFLIEEDVIHLKISCQSLRERALLEFLYCTGCRVGEVEKINIEDLNWENCSAIVNGKGLKQREIYFTTECKVWLKKYLASREDSCKALFVTDTQNGLQIEERLKRMYTHIDFGIPMPANSLITVPLWISSKVCSVMRRHQPRKSTHSSAASAGENFIDDFFSI